MNILNILKTYTNEQNILINEPLKNHTTFKIGGNADYVVVPENREEVVNIIKSLKSNQINFFIMGNGSNLLVKDSGFGGVIVKLGQKFSNIDIEDGLIKVDAGATLTKISNVAINNSLSGFEELSGIPGSLGGAVYMNAGAYDREIKDVLYDITFLDEAGEVKTVSVNDVKMEYRKTYFSENDVVILGATLKLEKGEKEKIVSRTREVTKMRVDKQPLNFPSAGSTFKRPSGYFAGKLIEDAGLKGYSVGGAKVSEKHAGFVINFNNATYSDVINLTEDIKRIVKEKFDVSLELEVEIL